MEQEYIITDRLTGKKYRVKGRGTKEQALEYFERQQQQKQAQPQEQPQAAEEPSVMEQVGRQVGLTARGAISGATAIPAMFADFLSVAGSKALGQPVPELPSQFIQRALTGIGLPAPKTPGERAVQAGVGAMTGVGLEAALAKAATKALPVQQAAQREAMLEPITQATGRQATVAAAAAPAAQFTMENLAEAGYGEGAQLAGALASALLAGGTTNIFFPKGRPIPTTVDEIYERGRRSYQELDNLGVTIKRDSALNFVNNIERNLVKQGFNKAFDVYKDADTVLEALRRQMSTGQKFGFRLSELDKIRQSIGGMYNKASPQSQKMIKMIIDGFDDQLEKAKASDFYLGSANKDQAVKTLRDARKNWRLSKRAKVLEDILDTSELRAGAGSGASEAQLIRQRLLGILSNPEKRAGFTKQEITAMQQVAKTGKLDSLLELAKQANIFRNPGSVAGIGRMGGMGGIGYISPSTAIMMTLGGIGADITQSALRKRGLEDLISGVLTQDVRAKPSMVPRTAVEAAKVGSAEQRPAIDVYYGDEQVDNFLRERGLLQ